MALTLQAVLDALADENGTEALTELLRGSTREELQAVEAEAMTTFDDVRASDDLRDDDIATLEALAGAVENVRGEFTRREEAAAELAERVSAVSERINAPAADPGDGDDDDGEDGEDADAGVKAEEDERELVTASAHVPAAKVDVAQLARRTRRPAAPAEQEDDGKPKFSQVFSAAADVPGFSAGHGFETFEQLARAFERRAQAKPGTRVGVARIQKFGFKERIPEGVVDITSYMDRAASKDNLTAAGWCSPSETWYDLCPSTVATTGLFSLPEVNAPRGGVRYSKGFDLASVSASGFRYTESELISGVSKPCITLPCPTFESEVRLGVEGICIATDIPLDSSYPEAVTRFLEIAMALHGKAVAGYRLAQVIAGSTDKGTVGATGEGATAAFFGALDLMAHNYRNVHSANWDELVQVDLPSWVKAIIRADIIKRNGIDSGESAIVLADSVINSGLALRNIQVQWINTSHPGDTNDVFQTPAQYATTGPTQWPQTVLATMYFPGSWIALTKDVIELDTVYDSVGLAQNKFTQLFMENGVAVINRCNRSFKFTIPLCPDGTTAQTADILCTVP